MWSVNRLELSARKLPNEESRRTLPSRRFCGITQMEGTATKEIKR